MAPSSTDTPRYRQVYIDPYNQLLRKNRRYRLCACLYSHTAPHWREYFLLIFLNLPYCRFGKLLFLVARRWTTFGSLAQSLSCLVLLYHPSLYPTPNPASTDFRPDFGLRYFVTIFPLRFATSQLPLRGNLKSQCLVALIPSQVVLRYYPCFLKHSWILRFHFAVLYYRCLGRLQGAFYAHSIRPLKYHSFSYFSLLGLR